MVLRKPTVDRALLTFLQALCSKCALYKGLIRAPPVQIVEEHSREDERPRQSRFSSIPRSPCVELFGFGLYEVLDTFYETAAGGLVTQQRQREERDHQTADDKADAVDGIRNRNCLQAAEDGVAAADDADDEAQDGNSHELAGAEDAGDVEDLLENDCTGVQDDRQVEDGVHNNDYQREHRLGALAVALLHQGRDGHGAHFQVLRQEVVRQNQQGEHRADLPCDRAHVGLPALAVQTDELFSGKVGQQQRTGDDYARQAAACQEITLSGVELLVAGLPCGNDCNEDCEQQERDSCPCE